MTSHTPYAAAAEVEAAPLINRSAVIRALGGQIWTPEEDAWTYEESRYLIDLLGIHADGPDRHSAINKWIDTARQRTPRNASDRRPDCPYNGQAPAPAT